ncbi:MAG: hypothetical protein MI824_14670 [Hyphomicrobiales bacterium]|nr:hypothetical protein [Hyphomicrobiales bacterium]
MSFFRMGVGWILLWAELLPLLAVGLGCVNAIAHYASLNLWLRKKI